MSFYPRLLRQSILLLVLIVSTQLTALHTLNYTAKNGIASNAVRKIFVDHEHRVWLGTDNGVSVMTANSITNYVYSNGLTHDRIWDIVQCPDSSMWFGSFGNGVYSFRNEQFTHHPLPRSERNNSVRCMLNKGDNLYVGTDAGLNVINYKTGKLVEFRNLSPFDSILVMEFLEYKGRLLFQTHQHGTFEINIEQKNYQQIRTREIGLDRIYTAWINEDSIYLSRSRFDKTSTNNILRGSMSDFLSGRQLDSLQLNTVAWDFSKASQDRIFAACWGVRDASGGLYLLENNQMVEMNETMGVDSRNLWDLHYDKVTNRLYIGTRDKGLFIVDLNRLVNVSKLVGDVEVLDIEVMEDQLYVLTADRLMMIRNGSIEVSLDKTDLEKLIKKNRPVFDYRRGNSPAAFTLRELIKNRNYIALNTNQAFFTFNSDLKLRAHVILGSDLKVCFLPNDNALVFHTFDKTELVVKTGVNQYSIYDKWDEKAVLPYHVKHFMRLNDSTYLTDGRGNSLYLYHHQKKEFSEVKPTPNMLLSGVFDRISENEFYMIDHANVLFKGIYRSDSLLFIRQKDLSSQGVMESYFIEVQGNTIIIANNLGVHVVYKGHNFLIDNTLGLPINAIIHGARVMQNILYLSSSEGLLTVDLDRLSKFPLSFKLFNLYISVDGVKIPFIPGDFIKLTKTPKDLLINWEVNQHPYPNKLIYSIRTNEDTVWHRINTRGNFRLFEPKWGKTNIQLQVLDEMNGEKVEYELATIYLVRPIYLRWWFIILADLLIIWFLSRLYYQVRIFSLKKSRDKVSREAKNLQLKWDTLQFLMKPHFIFNALTSIQNLMLKKDLNRSLEYNQMFSKYLRNIMQDNGDELVRLEDELKNIHNYIELEKLRFNDKIQVNIQIDENIDPQEVYCIPFLFQPLLENIFKHAFSSNIEQARIDIIISRKKNKVEYLIKDNGKGLGGTSFDVLLNRHESKGLKIIEAQLLKFYRNKHRFSASDSPEGGSAWIIRTPMG